MKIRKDDEVIVITGKYKGTITKVIKSFPKINKLILEGVNVVKKHKKANSQNPGAIVDKTMPIDVSNVAFLDTSSKKPAKIGYKLLENKKKSRFSKKTGNIIN